MTDDLGPGATRSDDLAAVFAAYLAVAAGLAAERDAEDVVTALGRADQVDVTLAAAPLTAAAGDRQVAVDVTLHLPQDAPDLDSDVVAELLSEAAAPDGFRVQHVQVRRAT